MNIVEKQLRILNNFILLLLNVNTESSFNAYIASWNKYKKYYDDDVDEIRNKINEIENIISNISDMFYEKYILEKNTLYESYDCKNKNYNKNVLFTEIQNYINFYLEMNEEDAHVYVINFINWLINISKCEDISIFNKKIDQLIFKYKDYLQNIDFSKMRYTTVENKPMLLTDFFKKKYRECSILKEPECNEECYWSNNFIDKINIFSSKCKKRNINDIIYNSYCSVDSYKNKDEIIQIIILLYGDNDNYKGLDRMIKRKIKIQDTTYQLDDMDSKELCKLIKNFLDNNYLLNNYNLENQNQFWNKFNINNYTGKCALCLIQDSINNDYSNYKILERLKNFFTKRGKSILIAISVSIFILMSIFAYSNSAYIMNKLYYWNILSNTETPNEINDEPNFKNYNNNNENPPEIPDAYKNDIMEKNKISGLNLNVIAGDDNKISEQEYQKFLELCVFFKNGKPIATDGSTRNVHFIEYVEKTLKPYSSELMNLNEVKIVPNITNNEIEEISKQIKDTNFTALTGNDKKIFLNKSNIMDYLSGTMHDQKYIENPNLNPLKVLVEKHNYNITTENVPINKINIPYKYDKSFINKITSTFTSFLNGLYPNYQNETVTLVKCVEQGQDKYYIYDKNVSFIMRLLINTGDGVNSNIINTNGSFNDFIKNVNENKIFISAREETEFS